MNKRMRLAALAAVATTGFGVGAGVSVASTDDPAVHTVAPGLRPCGDVCRDAVTARAVGDVQPFVVGGRDATERYPWMASIQIPDDTGQMQHTCGGALIRPDAVVTAAHCGVHYQVGSTQVRVGSSRWQDGGELAQVNRIDIYPGYGDGTQPGNDVAVVHLDHAVSHQTIPIARDPGRVGDLDRAIGFGATCDYGSPQWPCNPAGLQEADVRIVNDNECAEFDRSVELCVKGDQGQMVCYGDSGGPLLRKVHGRLELIGATRGDGDADSGGDNPNLDCSGDRRGGLGIFTDLTKYPDWIEQTADAPVYRPVSALATRAIS